MTTRHGLRAQAAPLVKTMLLRLGGYAASRTLLPSRSVAILRYHAICGPEGYVYADPGICISPAAFEQHVQYLAAHYSVLPLPEVVSRIGARQPLPKNTVVITFDDGYADNLAAARVLHRYGLNGTFYLTAGCLAGGDPFWPSEVRYLVGAMRPSRTVLSADGAIIELDLATSDGRTSAIRRLNKTFKQHPIATREALREQLRTHAGVERLPQWMLAWDEVREMHALGMTIGSHTLTHPNLPNAGLAAAREELLGARRRLETEVSAPVTMFSYPNGGAERYQTPELRRLVAETGYAAATTSHNGHATTGSDVYALERVEVEERLEDLIFALEIERFAFQPRPRRAQAPVAA